MILSVFVRLVLVLLLAAAIASSCGSQGREVSRGASGNCVRAWNVAGNAANRKVVVTSTQPWKVEVSRWIIDHPAPSSTGKGCSYFFFTDLRWMTFSGTWEQNGDLRWAKPPKTSHPRSPQQRILGPTTTIDAGGMIR
jgi:hypothetical protein